MDNNVIVMLGTGILSLIMVIVLLWFIISLAVLVKLRKQFKTDSESLQVLKEGNKDKVIEYSRQVLDFIRMMVSQVAVIKFRTFIDNRKVDKISKNNIGDLVADVATTVNKSINMSNIQIDNTIYSREFFEQYIVETSVLMVKELLEKNLSDDTDDNKGGKE